jgi:hypothetical protein
MNIQDIKQKNDICEVVGRWVELRRKGAYLVGRCPFHDDSKPSFAVSERLQRYKCFACGASGDVVDFVANITNKGKKEALQALTGGGSVNYTAEPRKSAKAQENAICHIDPIFVSRSRHDETNTLFQYLVCVFGRSRVAEAFEAYRVGTTKTGDAIFWQIDTMGRVRSGKIMRYKEDGHRDKNTPPTWTHTKLMKSGRLSGDYQLTQCLFGEHLLTDTQKVVCLVESEKTAIIGSICMNSCVWVACGGASNLNGRLRSLKGRKVVVFADIDAVGQWSEAVAVARAQGYDITIDGQIAKLATDEDRRNKIDVGDLLIRCGIAEPSKEALFEGLRRTNEAFNRFCTAFDLVAV